jgi:valyl-tRNA synthetase
MLASYPAVADFPRDEEAEAEIAWVEAVVLAIRQMRSGMNVKPSKAIPVLLQNASQRDKEFAEKHLAFVERLAGLESLTLLEAGVEPPQSATALVGELSILLPMAGLIDAGAEAERLGKLLAKAQQDLTKTKAKMANENFVRNAPPDVVENERARIVDLDRTVTSLTEQLERVRRLFKP